MAVLQALQSAVGATRRNPVLFLVAAAFSLLQLPGMLAQAVDPLVGSLVSLGVSVLSVFVVPFFLAGVVGMANEALDGRTSVGSFVREGKAHYVSVLVVYLVLFAVNFVLGAVGFVAAVFGGAFFLGGPAQSSPLTLALVAGVVLVFGLAYLAVLLVTQFFGHAIVVDDVGAAEGLKRSARSVRGNLLAVLGYSLVVAVVGGLFGLVAGAVSVLTSTGFRTAGAAATPSPATHLPLGLSSVGPVGIVGLAVVFVVLSGLLGGFFAAFSTAFYRRVRPAAP
jgi:hypothetical protein